MANKTKKLRETFALKLKQRRNIVLQKGYATGRQLLSLAGMAAWVGAALNFDLLHVFTVLRYAARAARGRDLDKHHELNGEFRAELLSLQRAAFCEVPFRTSFQGTRGKLVLITDAHKLDGRIGGWGIIAIRDGKLEAVAGTFNHNMLSLHHINVLELWTVKHALKLFARQDDQVFCVTDNTVVCYVMQSFMTRSQLLSPHLKEMKQTSTDRNLEINTSWVQSKEMPADGLSRQKDLSENDIKQVNDILGGVGVLESNCSTISFPGGQTLIL